MKDIHLACCSQDTYSFVDRDMFMRYRGGAIGHKTMRKETKCLLEDRDKLDNIPFMLESEREQEFYRENEDIEMDRGEIDTEDEDGDGDEDENDNEMEVYSTDDEEIRGSDGTNSGAEDAEVEKIGHDEDDDESDSDDDADMVINPDSISTLMANDELLDEMDEFGYSGLDQVVEDDENKEDDDIADDALGTEDGENDTEGWDEDFAEGHL